MTNSNPWLLFGDFNEVITVSEKFGGNPINISTTSAFLHFCSIGMHDLGFTSSRFTWTNNRKLTNSLILERQDSFLANVEWLQPFQDSSVLYLPRAHSDHCPIILNLANVTTRPSSTFWFETMWISHPGFAPLIDNIWSDKDDYLLTLTQFTSAVKSWNHTCFGNIFRKK